MIHADFQPSDGSHARPFEAAERLLASRPLVSRSPSPLQGSRPRRRVPWRDQPLSGLFEDLAPRCQYNPRELARTLGVSARHLQRLFAAAFGRPPRDWLNEHRLLRARQLLGTAGSVKEVAYALGFRGVSQFSRDFRVQFGIVPSALLGRGKPQAAPQASARP
jgi:transcriptional regulator GlxA family with amidase domain